MNIKNTAGKVLLVLYSIQTRNPIELLNYSLQVDLSDYPTIEGDNRLVDNLHGITKDDALLYNAINYLFDKGFIEKGNNANSMGALWLRKLRLTDLGVDVIEGIENGDSEKKKFGALFSITLNNSVNIESLLKAEVGNIVGVGGAVSGKVENKL